MRSQAILLCSCSLALAAMTAWAQTTPQTQERTTKTNQVSRPRSFIKASDFIKYDVENDKGEDLGDVKELLYDPVHERVAVIAVSHGGVLGVGDKLYAVPWNAMTLSPDGKKKILLKFNKDQIKQAPRIDTDHWPETIDPQMVKEFTTFYSVTPYWADEDNASKADNPTDSSKTMFLRRVSAILDAKVENDSGEKLGKVEDLAVSTEEGRILYAVLSFGGVLGVGDKYFALPIGCFDFKGQDPKKLVLHIDKEKLKSAPGFDKSAWPNMADERWVNDIHSYYNQKPYWDRNKSSSQ